MGTGRARPVVVDAGPLVGFERGDERMRALVRETAVRGTRLVVPSGVLAQVWRDGARQARPASLVRSPGTVVEPLDGPLAKAVGAVCGRTGATDVVDASVVLTARTYGAVVVTGDPDDLRRLGSQVELVAI